MYNKAFKFKLKPNKEQEQLFWQYAGAVRYVWNRALFERSALYKLTGKSPTRFQQDKGLTGLKKDHDTFWLSGINAQVLQRSLADLDQSFKNFFDSCSGKRKGGKVGYPRYKSRKGKNSFTYPQGVKVDDSQVYLPKIGWVRFRKSQDIEGTIKRATVSHKESGWYVSIVIEIDNPLPPLATVDESSTVGIDVGLIDYVTLSNGDKEPAPRFFRTMQRKLAKEQRKLSRGKKGSNRREKQRRKVAKLHERIANMRWDFIHKLTTQIVRDFDTIGVEDLNVKGLARTRLAKSICDASFGEFFRQLEYKSEWYGKNFHKVDRFFPSSKTCSECACINDLTLSDRIFVCVGCGKVLDRDLNAATNIKNKTLVDLLAVGHTDSVNAHGGTVSLA
jgi:putative transposase